jgi:hypothetical protein
MEWNRQRAKFLSCGSAPTPSAGSLLAARLAAFQTLRGDVMRRQLLAGIAVTLFALGATAAPPEPVKVTIDYTQPTTPARMHVRAGRTVKLTIVNKSPFATCEVNAPRTAVEKPDALGDILNKIFALVPGVAFKRGASALKTGTAAPKVAPAPECDECKKLEQLLTAKEDIFKKIGEALKDRKAKLDALYESKPTDSGQFRAALESRSEAIQQLLQTYGFPEALSDKYGPPISLADTRASLHLVRELVAREPKTGTATLAFVAGAAERQAELERMQGGLLAALAELSKHRTYLEGLKKDEHPFEYTYEFKGDRDVERIGPVSCKSSVTGKTTMEPIPVSILWQNPPRATLSASVLVSFVEKHSYGTATLPANVTGMKVDSATVTDDTGRAQVVPFSWVNIRVKDWREGKFTFNVSPGIGVNTNSGSNQVEFALGPAFGYHRCYFFAGYHFARPASVGAGYTVGSLVPASSFTLPVSHSWHTGFGVGISYQLAPVK